MAHYEDMGGHHHTEFVRLPQHAGGDASVFYPVMRVPAGKGIVVDEVMLWPEDTITGADTNTHHVNALTKTSAGGAGAELANKDFVNGVNGTAGTTYALTIASATTVVTAGYIVGIQYEKIGTGGAVALGDQLVSIKWHFAH